jgi:hypothetical protein
VASILATHQAFPSSVLLIEDDLSSATVVLFDSNDNLIFSTLDHLIMSLTSKVEMELCQCIMGQVNG